MRAAAATGAIVPALRVSGGGSTRFEVNGADNSVQAFGSEASR
jgi:hypothetical protein